MSLSIDDDWLKPSESDQRDVGHSSSVSGGKLFLLVRQNVDK